MQKLFTNEKINEIMNEHEWLRNGKFYAKLELDIDERKEEIKEYEYDFDPEIHDSTFFDYVEEVSNSPIGDNCWAPVYNEKDYLISLFKDKGIEFDEEQFTTEFVENCVLGYDEELIKETINNN